jgi:hypothetical protein
VGLFSLTITNDRSFILTMTPFLKRYKRYRRTSGCHGSSYNWQTDQVRLFSVFFFKFNKSIDRISKCIVLRHLAAHFPAYQRYTPSRFSPLSYLPSSFWHSHHPSFSRCMEELYNQIIRLHDWNFYRTSSFLFYLVPVFSVMTFTMTTLRFTISERLRHDFGFLYSVFVCGWKLFRSYIIPP